MKKIVFAGIAVLAITATVVFNVNLNAQGEKLADVSLANVEALADGEYPIGPYLNNCYSWFSPGQNYMVCS
ncbi:hypothetical protein FACS189455_2770 [Bacteroidia bacterium]|nr:hypothetical protein FACS189455_2770 [Bacteroidia bacterium]